LSEWEANRTGDVGIAAVKRIQCSCAGIRVWEYVVQACHHITILHHAANRNVTRARFAVCACVGGAHLDDAAVWERVVLDQHGGFPGELPLERHVVADVAELLLDLAHSLEVSSAVERVAARWSGRVSGV
jgi:hypothetical protein